MHYAGETAILTVFFFSKTLSYYEYNKWIYYSNFRVCVHTYVCQIYIPLGSTNCKPGYIK